MMIEMFHLFVFFLASNQIKARNIKGNLVKTNQIFIEIYSPNLQVQMQFNTKSSYYSSTNRFFVLSFLIFFFVFPY